MTYTQFSLHYMGMIFLQRTYRHHLIIFSPESTIHNMTELHVNTTTYHKHLLEHNFPPVHHTMQSQLYGINWNCLLKQHNQEQVSKQN